LFYFYVHIWRDSLPFLCISIVRILFLWRVLHSFVEDVVATNPDFNAKTFFSIYLHCHLIFAAYLHKSGTNLTKWIYMVLTRLNWDQFFWHSVQCKTNWTLQVLHKKTFAWFSQRTGRGRIHQLLIGRVKFLPNSNCSEINATSLSLYWTNLLTECVTDL